MAADRSRRVVVCMAPPDWGKTRGLLIPTVRRYVQLHGPESVRGLDVSGDLDSDLPELGACWEWPGYDGVDEWFKNLTGNGKGPAGGGWGPGLLVLPDADRYMSPFIMNTFTDLAIANRHLGLDAIIDGHRPQRFPKDLLEGASELWWGGISEPGALEYAQGVKGLGTIVTHHLRLIRAIDPVKREKLISDAARMELLPLPFEPGQFLRVFPRTGEVQAVRLFPPGGAGPRQG